MLLFYLLSKISSVQNYEKSLEKANEKEEMSS